MPVLEELFTLFSDGKDLNRAFPGQVDGVASKVFAHNMLEKIINCFNYHIDLHTASFGRVNSYYVRADMNNEHTAMMAKLQKPQIILHNSGQDGEAPRILKRIIKPDLMDRYFAWNLYATLDQFYHCGDRQSAAVSKSICDVVVYWSYEHPLSSQDDESEAAFRTCIGRGLIEGASQ